MIKVLREIKVKEVNAVSKVSVETLDPLVKTVETERMSSQVHQVISTSCRRPTTMKTQLRLLTQSLTFREKMATSFALLTV